MSVIRPPKTKKAVFDTNVYIEAIQGGPEAQAYQLLLSALPRTYLSAVVVQPLTGLSRGSAGPAIPSASASWTGSSDGPNRRAG